MTEATEGEGNESEKRRGEDWLFDGQSRRVLAEELPWSKCKNEWPEWLNTSDGNVLSTPHTTAQVWCQFTIIHYFRQRSLPEQIEGGQQQLIILAVILDAFANSFYISANSTLSKL